MFTAITWKTFCIVAVIILAVYYASIFLWSYKGTIKNKILRRKTDDNTFELEQNWTDKNSEDHFNTFREPEVANDDKDEMTDEAFEQAGELSQRIKDLVQVAQTESYSKTAFINSLSTLIQQYPGLNIPSFRVAINNKIKTACSEYRVYRLSEEDLAAVWTT